MYSSRDITAAFHSNMLEAELGHGFVTLVALHLLLTETDKKLALAKEPVKPSDRTEGILNWIVCVLPLVLGSRELPTDSPNPKRRSPLLRALQHTSGMMDESYSLLLPIRRMGETNSSIMLQAGNRRVGFVYL